ncbi:hypothetical protein LCGC14_1160580 [marine sediment metagenome]|uniref:Uncharacterized protein n=1 Tax=marine sediment metagenome TaxID=412755 RepID=A0A0F9MFR5_9ZZZZ
MPNLLNTLIERQRLLDRARDILLRYKEDEEEKANELHHQLEALLDQA